MDLPGLLRERYRGRIRYRVRVQGDKHRRITVPPPTHPDFIEYYRAARRGEVYKPDALIPRSLDWLVQEYSVHAEKMIGAGLLTSATVRQRMAFYRRLCDKHGRKHMAMPPEALVEFRDAMIDTPGAADNMVKAVRALYKWAKSRGLVDSNPAENIERVNVRSRGAVPWTIADLKQYRDRHQQGTMAHLALTLFMFTSARIGDACILGRDHETRRDGVSWLEWQPGKKGSAPVSIPIMPPLRRAIDAQKVVGPAYLLNNHGRPFASKNAFGNWFSDRIREAGLIDRSSHGVRKAAGELLALEGATQYQIMAVHGHTQAKTSEVYTKGVSRRDLSRTAIDKLASMDW